MMGHSTTRKVLKGHGLITSYYVGIPNHLPLKPSKARRWEFSHHLRTVSGRRTTNIWLSYTGFLSYLEGKVSVCVLICVLFFVISWTVTARFLCLWNFPGNNTEWITASYSRGSSWPRDQTPVSGVSYISRWVLYHQHHPGSPTSFWTASLYILKKFLVLLK